MDNSTRESQMVSFLRVSTQVFEMLSNNVEGEEREAFIEELNEKLELRGEIINQLISQGIEFNKEDKLHLTLFELDKGIRERLIKFMQGIKNDMKDLQNAKKNEQQYMNPYASVRVMDGMYYDKKK